MIGFILGSLVGLPVGYIACIMFPTNWVKNKIRNG